MSAEAIAPNIGIFTFMDESLCTRESPYKADKVCIWEHGGLGTGSLAAVVTTNVYGSFHGATNCDGGAVPPSCSLKA